MVAGCAVLVTAFHPLPSALLDPMQPLDPGPTRLQEPSLRVVEEHWSLFKLLALDDLVFVKKRVRYFVKGKKISCNNFSSREVRLVYCYLKN